MMFSLRVLSVAAVFIAAVCSLALGVDLHTARMAGEGFTHPGDWANKAVDQRNTNTESQGKTTGPHDESKRLATSDGGQGQIPAFVNNNNNNNDNGNVNQGILAQDAPVQQARGAGRAGAAPRFGGPLRGGEDQGSNKAKYYVDAHHYMEDVAKSIQEAQLELLIADWQITVDLFLVRPGVAGGRLSQLLRDAIENRQVSVYILAFKAKSIMGDFAKSEPAAKLLKELYDSLSVAGKRRLHYTFYSRKDNNRQYERLDDPIADHRHSSFHQKHVIVDRTLLYMGGIDLALCRWDDEKHTLDWRDPKVFEDSCPATSDHDAHRPRMPWHDIGVLCTGSRLLQRTIQTFCRRYQYSNRAVGKNGLWRSDSDLPSVRGPQAPTNPQFSVKGLYTGLDIGVYVTEKSKANPLEEIHTAYLNEIQHSQHYIYIENQYFISGLKYMHNQIADALIARVRRAIAENSPFLIEVVTPLVPNSDINDCNNQWLTHYMQQTRDRIRNQLGTQAYQKYFHFYWLNQIQAIKDWSPTHLLTVSKPIYVHSKMMLVDDRVAIIGSANINDRSMVRLDDEIAVVIKAPSNHMTRCLGGSVIKGPMAKAEGYCKCKFVSDLRQHTFRHHLTRRGIKLGNPFATGANTIAHRNLRNLQNIFGTAPGKMGQVAMTDYLFQRVDDQTKLGVPRSNVDHNADVVGRGVPWQSYLTHYPDWAFKPCSTIAPKSMLVDGKKRDGRNNDIPQPVTNDNAHPLAIDPGTREGKRKAGTA